MTPAETTMPELTRASRTARSYVVEAANRRPDILAMLEREGFRAFDAYERATDAVIRGLVKADEMRHVVFAVDRDSAGRFVAVLDEDWFLLPGLHWANVFNAIESTYRSNLAARMERAA